MKAGLPDDYFRNNYGKCRLGDNCHCVRNLGSWMGALCAQWEPTQARSFEELMEIAKKERASAKNRQSTGTN